MSKRKALTNYAKEKGKESILDIIKPNPDAQELQPGEKLPMEVGRTAELNRRSIVENIRALKDDPRGFIEEQKTGFGDNKASFERVIDDKKAKVNKYVSPETQETVLSMGTRGILAKGGDIRKGGKVLKILKDKKFIKQTPKENGWYIEYYPNEDRMKERRGTGIGYDADEDTYYHNSVAGYNLNSVWNHKRKNNDKGIGWYSFDEDEILEIIDGVGSFVDKDGERKWRKYAKGGRVRYMLNGFEENLNYILDSTNAVEVAREGSKEDGDLVIYFETKDEEYAKGGEIRRTRVLEYPYTSHLVIRDAVKDLKEFKDYQYGGNRAGYATIEIDAKYLDRIYSNLAQYGGKAEIIDERIYAKGGIVDKELLEVWKKHVGENHEEWENKDEWFDEAYDIASNYNDDKGVDEDDITELSHDQAYELLDHYGIRYAKGGSIKDKKGRVILRNYKQGDRFRDKYGEIKLLDKYDEDTWVVRRFRENGSIAGEVNMSEYNLDKTKKVFAKGGEVSDEELDWRLKCIKADLKMASYGEWINKDIDKRELLNNINIASDLSDNESLDWTCGEEEFKVKELKKVKEEKKDIYFVEVRYDSPDGSDYSEEHYDFDNRKDAFEFANRKERDGYDIHSISYHPADGGEVEDLYAKGGLTSKKARKMLKDGMAQGKPLTDKQKRYFGALAAGKEDKIRKRARMKRGGKVSVDKFMPILPLSQKHAIKKDIAFLENELAKTNDILRHTAIGIMLNTKKKSLNK